MVLAHAATVAAYGMISIVADNRNNGFILVCRQRVDESAVGTMADVRLRANATHTIRGLASRAVLVVANTEALRSSAQHPARQTTVVGSVGKLLTANLNIGDRHEGVWRMLKLASGVCTGEKK